MYASSSVHALYSASTIVVLTVVLALVIWAEYRALGKKSV
jgi:hypothetical protein